MRIARLFALLLLCPVLAVAQQLPRTELTAGVHLIRAEVADNFVTRMQGLMHRTSMGANEGMLFVNDDVAVRCFWMRNTLIPLSIAFVSDDGTIVNITTVGKIDLRLKVDNTAGFILTGVEVNDSGKDTDTVVVRTNTSWQESSTEPYWRPAMILRTLTAEAATRGVYRLAGLTYGYSITAPTSGSWTTEVDLTLKVGVKLISVL